MVKSNSYKSIDRVGQVIVLLSLLFVVGSLSAREVYNVSNDWRLFASAEGSADRAKSVSLPYSWSLERNTSVNESSINLLRVLHAPMEWSNRRIFMRFGAVANVADLFVNGEYAGTHRGGATAFTLEITPYLNMGESNVVVLRVSSIPQNDILPTSVEHEVYGGVYRDVELIVTSKSAISPKYFGADALFVTTKSIDNGVVKGEVVARFISNNAVERRLTLTIYDKEGQEIFREQQSKVKIDGKSPITIPFVVNALAWSPEEPNLYSVKLALNSVGEGLNEIVGQRDEVSVVTGFRTITTTPKGALLLNGVKSPMRGVSLYHDHPRVGADLTPQTYREDMSVVQDLGANAIRSAVVPHDQYLYSLCDSLGVMAWVELPFARSPYLSDVGYFPNARFEENGLQQLREIIFQNYNHPSVMMWGIFSLLSTRGDLPDKYITRLHNEAKRLDPTRPTVALSNQSGTLNTITDLMVWRQDIGWSRGQLSDIAVWSDQLHNKWGHLRSAVLYGEEGSVEHQSGRKNLVEVRSRNRAGWFPEVRQTVMHEVYASKLCEDEVFWGLWISSLFDFKSPRSILGERAVGLVSFDRESRKDAYYLYRALWNEDEPTLHIADKRLRRLMLNEKIVTLRVYASELDGESPIATINGEEREMRRIAPSQFVLEGLEVEDRLLVEVNYGDLTDRVEFIAGSPLRTPER